MIKGLPEKLKEQREKYHLSQKDVADQLHISPSIISGYETGERTPSTEKLLALSYLYHCSTDYLLGRVPMAVEAKKETPPESPEGVQKIKTAAAIPAEHAQLIAALEAFVRRIVHEELQRRDSPSYSHPRK